MRDAYDPGCTMREARDQYFKANNFGETGGYDDAWVDFHLGPLPCPFPNTRARVRAVKVHDLHHILTGYRTDTIGEFEIAAWELGAGCKDFYAAWVLNLGGMAAGMLSAPRRTFRAFVRGRRTQSLYGRQLDELLTRTVAEMRAATRADVPAEPATAGDVARFVAFLLAAVPVSALEVAIGVVVIPIGLLTAALRRAKAREAQAIG